MPRHGRRRRDSANYYDSDMDSFMDGYALRVHRRPLDNDIRRSHSHAGVRRRFDRNGDVVIDIHNHNRQHQSQSSSRSRSRSRSRDRSRLRSVSRRREDLSELEDEIMDRTFRKIRREQRRQEEQEERLRRHQLEQQQQWAAPAPRRARSTSPVERTDLLLMEERLKRKYVEEQLRRQHHQTHLVVPEVRESRSRGRSHSRHRRRDYSESSSDSSSDEEYFRRQVRRARSRGRDEAEREIELQRLLKMEHDDRAKRHLKEAIRLDKLEAMEREKEEEEQEQQVREKIKLEEAKKAAEEEEKRREINRVKREAIDEHLHLEATKEKKLREEEKQRKKDLERQMKPLLLAQGYTEQEAEDIIKGEIIAPPANQVKAVKVHSDDISPEALDQFDLPWDWEKPRSGGWIIIHQDVSQGMIDQLMDLTRQLRQRLLPAPPPPHAHVHAPERKNVVITNIKDSEKDRIFLVRKKKKRSGFANLFSLV